MLESGIIFRRERKNTCPGYVQGLPCDQAFYATTQNPTVTAQHSFHKPSSTETLSMYLHSCRLPSTSCSYFLNEYDGLKPLLTQTSQGRARLTAWRCFPRVYWHLETAAVASTCEWVVMKGNEPQPEASWLSFYLPEILSVLVLPKCSLWNMKQLLPGKVPTNRKTSPGVSKWYWVCLRKVLRRSSKLFSTISSSGK